MKKTTVVGGDIMAMAPTAEAEAAAVHAPARGVHVHAHVRAADGPDAAKRIFTTGNCIKNKKRADRRTSFYKNNAVPVCPIILFRFKTNNSKNPMIPERYYSCASPIRSSITCFTVSIFPAR